MKYCFFDLDGTLADTDGDIREAWRKSLKEMGLECPTFDTDFVTGPPIEEMVKRLFPERFAANAEAKPHCGEKLCAELRAMFGKHYDKDGFPMTHEYPGIMETVAELRRRGDRVYIVTNKRYAGAMAIAGKFGWQEKFDGIYAGDMYKDDPAIGKLKKGDLLKVIMRQLNCRVCECIMIGDTISDFDAANENGMVSIAVEWGYGTEEERKLATCRVATPGEILSRID